MIAKILRWIKGLFGPQCHLCKKRINPKMISAGNYYNSPIQKEPICHECVPKEVYKHIRGYDPDSDLIKQVNNIIRKKEHYE